ncbi:MAG: thiosulfate sulfurtransferase GlpE, partial [Candidatus Sericytochromatia bacterium]
SVAEAKALLEAKAAVFVDVRDPGSFSAGHIPGALHVNDHNLESFMDEADKATPHVVYCYHGHSSLGGTGYFLENGFADVKSMDGGFSQWHQLCPDLVES